jgi:hypothetical protein
LNLGHQMTLAVGTLIESKSVIRQTVDNAQQNIRTMMVFTAVFPGWLCFNVLQIETHCAIAYYATELNSALNFILSFVFVSTSQCRRVRGVGHIRPLHCDHH